MYRRETKGICTEGIGRTQWNFDDNFSY
jgi:hypothetical protein